MDLLVFPKNHQLSYIIYDSDSREYYNTRTDIFLSEDDISFHKLRPYDKITTPLPYPLPPNYFTDWN